MNSRRRIASPPKLTTMGLQQGFANGEMGFRVRLHGSNPLPLMSALGQKRTSQRIS
jgi:hypothetical protein